MLKETVFYSKEKKSDYNLKIALTDPQTSGGVLFGVDEVHEVRALEKLRDSSYEQSSFVGYVEKK